MIFRSIEYRLAMLFTGFVFLLFLMNGIVFIGAELAQERAGSTLRLEKIARNVLERPGAPGSWNVPSKMRDRVRVMADDGSPLVSTPFYDDIPFIPAEGISSLMVEDEPFDAVTVALRDGSTIRGYVQVADRRGGHRFVLRLATYAGVSIVVSGLAYLVGLWFARRSLKPAVDAFLRLEQFTQDVSHELRTPIAAASSSLELAKLAPMTTSYIDDAAENLQQIRILIDRLLELARLDGASLQPTSFDIVLLLREIVSLHSDAAARAGVSLTIEAPETSIIVADRVLLRQAIGNLVDNAIRHTRANGSVVLRLSDNTLEIIDTGVGIAPEHRAKIFDRLYQVSTARSRSSYQGTGLGLALVRRIVDLHRWHIAVQSTVGEGTTFTLRIRKLRASR